MGSSSPPKMRTGVMMVANPDRKSNVDAKPAERARLRRPNALKTAPTIALAPVLLGADLLEPLQAGRHGLGHRVGPVDPGPAVAQEILGQGTAIKDFGDDGGVVPVRIEDVAPAVASRYSDFGWIIVLSP